MLDVKHRARKLNVVKRDDGVNYFSDLLDLIKLPLVHLSEWATTESPRYAIRHDVDHDIDTALLIAEAEAHRGYKSTYFLLTPGSYGQATNYYGTIREGLIIHDSKLIENCRRFMELGHHVGFHNDIVSLALRFRKDPADILKREVDFFAKNGIPLAGTAAHGNPLARQLMYSNEEIFRSCIRKSHDPDMIGRIIEFNGWQIKLHSLNLADYGFSYEAYSLSKNAHITDSGRRWRVREGKTKYISNPEEPFNKERFQDLLPQLVFRNESISLHILTHPCHWDVYDEKNNKISVFIRSHPKSV